MITQKPTEPNTWLYKDIEDGERLWAREVVLANEQTERWKEATEEEYEAWQKEHEEDNEPKTDE